MSSVKSPNSSVISQGDSVEFESFSSLHLSKRVIPHKTLTRTLAGKKTYTLANLLKTVVAPDFALPDVEEDIVVLAIVAAKSEPKTQKNGAGAGKKFMIISLCDLKWEVDLYLFDTGFTKYYKLVVGSVIAILNPMVMKPQKTDTGRWSFVINDSEDTILEIGNARDLGFCKSVKKDGETCNSWIDKRHTEFCEYHINEQLKKTKAGRMEVNTMDFGRGIGRSGVFGGRKVNTQDVTGHAKRRDEILRSKGKAFSTEIHSEVYMHKSGLGGDVVASVAEAGYKEEQIRKRRAQAEKERELQNTLAQMGRGMGADYMKSKTVKPPTQSLSSRPQPLTEAQLQRELRTNPQTRLRPAPNPDDVEPEWAPPPPPDAKALGLLSGKAGDVQLGAIKRKRSVASGSQPSSINSAPLGWGGQLSKELGRMKNGESLNGSGSSVQPPVKKKTRFVTEKGIREAGRESFGGEVAAKAIKVAFDPAEDDDDDLDIVR
jgi:minichromosome maintenance protein 10